MENKKILLTGARGTVGKLIVEKISLRYELYAPSSIELNLLNKENVVEYLIKHGPFHTIIHCAAVGANEVRSLDESIATNNLRMYFNIADYTNYYDRFINISSGCELGYSFDHRVDKNNVTEESLFECIPEYPYGLSKNIIARDVLKKEKRYNLRIWGIIADTRIFEKVSNCAKLGKSKFIVDTDRYVDYIHPDELVETIQEYIERDNIKFQDLNIVPLEKKKVSDTVLDYIERNNLDLSIDILSKSPYNYYGSGEKYHLWRNLK